MEKRKLRGSIEGRDSKVELVKKAQSFLNRVDDMVQVLLWIVHSRCSCRIIGLGDHHPIATTSSSCCYSTL
nr:hypothetical protein CFP56_51139 [Quercus suber]